jgi:hypothetical protein
MLIVAGWLIGYVVLWFTFYWVALPWRMAECL